MSAVKTVFFLGILTGLFLLAGYLVGGFEGLTIGFVFALLINFFSYWFSDKIVLAMYGAKEISKTENPVLHRLVEDVSRLSEIPKPKIFLIQNSSPNAFATGRNPQHSVVCFTTGILSLLDENELKGVIAHELSHIKNRDVLISSVAAVIAGTIAYIAFAARWAAIFGGFGGRDRDSNILELIVLAIITPLIATIVQLAISRTREFAADKTAAQTLHSHIGLASALKKLESGVSHNPMHSANKGTAHMFIVNPFSGENFFKLFSTHPPLSERIKKLREINY